MPAVFQVSLGCTSLLNSAVKYNHYCKAIQKTRTFVRCIDTVLYRAVLKLNLERVSSGGGGA